MSDATFEARLATQLQAYAQGGVRPIPNRNSWPTARTSPGGGWTIKPRRTRVPGRRYEFRIAGRVSERARAAFTGMDVAEVPAETVISGEVADGGGVQEVLTLIQSLGLELVAVRRAKGSWKVREQTLRPPD